APTAAPARARRPPHAPAAGRSAASRRAAGRAAGRDAVRLRRTPVARRARAHVESRHMVPTALAAIGIVAVAGLLAQLWRVQRALRVVERELRAVRAEMGHAAITDPLTGLYNRRLLKQVASHQIEHHRRFRLPLCVVYIDVDRFKEINDTHGHAVGDRVLAHVAAFINRYTREADYLFRVGGDEFLVLMSCTADEGQWRARELQASFPATLADAGLPSTLGLSVGVADVPTNVKDIEPAIKAADANMYED